MKSPTVNVSWPEQSATPLPRDIQLGTANLTFGCVRKCLEAIKAQMAAESKFLSYEHFASQGTSSN